MGAHAKWQITKTLRANAFTVAEFGTEKPDNRYTVALIYSPTKWLSITGGHTPPPLSAILRPYPLSGSSQFETWTQKRIPGGAPCVYATLSNKEAKFYGGVVWREHQTEFEAEVVYRSFTLGGYIRDSVSAIAGQISTKKFFQIAVFDNAKTLASTIVYNFRDYSLYCDIGYNFPTNTLPRLEIGALKNFSSKYVSGLFGLGGDIEAQSVNAYLFFHL